MADEEPKPRGKAIVRSKDPRGRSASRTPAREKRVRAIMEMMAAGEYHGIASRFALAEQWEIEPGTVKNDAAEAWRRLQADPEDIDAIRAAHAAFCMRMGAEAARDRSITTGLKDITGALKAVELAAKFQGIDISEPPVGAGRTPELRVVVVEEPEPDDPPAPDAEPTK